MSPASAALGSKAGRGRGVALLLLPLLAELDQSLPFLVVLSVGNTGSSTDRTTKYSPAYFLKGKCDIF